MIAARNLIIATTHKATPEKDYKTNCIYPKYLGRQTWANSVDLDQMLQSAAYGQGQHCLPLSQQFSHTSLSSKINFFKL